MAVSTANTIFSLPYTYENFWIFLPARRYVSGVFATATCLFVRLSVRLSVTRRYCVKTKKASVMISSPSGSPKTLVFWRQISSPNSKGFPPNGGLKQGWVGKIQRFSSFKRQYLENGSRYGQSWWFCEFGRQPRLNYWRETYNVSNGIVAHQMHFSTVYTLRRYLMAFRR